MPVTVYPAPHPSESCFLANLLRNASPEQVLRGCVGVKLKDGQTNPLENLGNIWSSSFSAEEHTDVFPSANGFVHAAIRAYNAHHHLRIRPDDVWMSILSQFSIYVNKYAEDLRSIFVSHQGKKALDLDGAVLNGFHQFASKITEVLSNSIKDKSVAPWIMQEFSTTTPTDRIAAGIIMMATFQSYFKYFDACTCGLPSVTLLGQRADWVQLLNAVDRLSTFVPEKSAKPSVNGSANTDPAAQITKWVSLLKPILSRFVASFDSPNSSEIVAFWQQIANYRVGGSGADYLSGWLTAFCFWNESGQCTHPLNDNGGYNRLILDGVGYTMVDWEDVPPGWATVPLEIDFDDNQVHKCRMLAGSVGITPFLARIEKSEGKSGPVAKNETTVKPSAQKGTGGSTGMIRKLLACCDPNTVESSSHAASGLHARPFNQKDRGTNPHTNDCQPVPGEEIVLPPYPGRPSTEHPVPYFDKGVNHSYENGGRWAEVQQMTNGPPSYRLDGLQPRNGWFLWEEDVVTGNAPLPDGCEDYKPGPSN
ncbi:MAG: hypothetical protein Q9227_008517 [Pyrenula ochraceoflavens]